MQAFAVQTVQDCSVVRNGQSGVGAVDTRHDTVPIELGQVSEVPVEVDVVQN